MDEQTLVGAHLAGDLDAGFFLDPVEDGFDGLAHLRDAADAWLSRAVSQVRQPVESIFNWIEEKTDIEIASKVRSYQGLLVHVFGRLAAAMFVRNVLLQSA